jgi:hypothetical protein
MMPCALFNIYQLFKSSLLPPLWWYIITVPKTTFLIVILCGCETSSLTLTLGKTKWKVLENGILKKISKLDTVTGGWRNLHMKIIVIHRSLSSPNNNLKLRRI